MVENANAPRRGTLCWPEWKQAEACNRSNFDGILDPRTASEARSGSDEMKRREAAHMMSEAAMMIIPEEKKNQPSKYFEAAKRAASKFEVGALGF